MMETDQAQASKGGAEVEKISDAGAAATGSQGEGAKAGDPERPEPRKRGDGDFLDLGFEPATRGFRLTETPNFSTSRLDLLSWKRTCEQVLSEASKASPSKVATYSEIRGFIRAMLTKLSANSSATEESLPVKLDLRHFHEHASLTVFVVQVVVPLAEKLGCSVGELAGKMDENGFVEAMRDFSAKLTASALQKKRKVFVSPDIDEEEAAGLKKVVAKLGGLVVPSAAFPGVTHVVTEPTEDVSDGELTLVQAKSEGRVREVGAGGQVVDGAGEPQGGQHTLLHRVGWPNSFDELVPSPAAVGEDDSASRRQAILRRRERLGCWFVSPAWVRESAANREWMCEADFEVLCFEDYGARAVEVVTQDELKELDERTRVVREQERRMKAERWERERMERKARREQVDAEQAAKRARKEAAAATAAADAPTVKAEPMLDAPAPASAPAAAEGGKVELHRVPAHSAWFRWDSAHEVERASLPEFFNGKSTLKTPQMYREYRNFIIDRSREAAAQGRGITFTECRKHLAGDVNCVYRVYNFLEHWGLINYGSKGGGAETVGDGVAAGPDRTAQNAASGSAPKQPEGKSKDVGFALPPDLKVVTSKKGYNVDTLVTMAGPGLERDPTGAVNPLRLVMKKNRVTGVSAAQAPAKEVKFVCNISGKECTGSRYHCVKIPDYDLSPESFEEMKKGQKPWPAGITETDFVRMDASPAAEGADPNAWTKEETLLLLEGLETHGENWQNVAEHVGTKSQLQCITFFLSLPIEDPFLDQLEGEKPGEGQEGGEINPFADTGNPVMAQVAFLATMVGPKVAAAAAKKALEVLCESDPALADSKEAAAGAGAEAMMDVDDKANGGPAKPEGEGTAEEALTKPPSAATVKAAVATGLAAAAVKAKLLADREEQEIQKLVIKVIEKQVMKLEGKMARFEELDTLLERERDEIQKGRQMLLMERVEQRREQIERQERAAEEEKQRLRKAEEEAAAAAAAAAAAKPKEVEVAAPAPMVVDAPKPAEEAAGGEAKEGDKEEQKPKEEEKPKEEVAGAGAGAGA